MNQLLENFPIAQEDLDMKYESELAALKIMTRYATSKELPEKLFIEHLEQGISEEVVANTEIKDMIFYPNEFVLPILNALAVEDMNRSSLPQILSGARKLSLIHI